LWNACPSSCETVDSWSKLPSKFERMRDSFTFGSRMQNPPPTFPSRGSASIQLCSKAFAAKSASSPLNVPNCSVTNETSSSHVYLSSTFPTGATRSHQGSVFFPSFAALLLK
jgi:hypothetical protein